MPSYARLCSAALLAALVLLLPAWPALAANPFGIGPGEAPAPSFLPWLAEWQARFYAGMTAALVRMKEEGSAAWTLLGLSFLYGIVHAAGPGHGKAVVSAYVVANRQTLRNGVLLAFLSAMAQSLTAIAAIAILAGVLKLSSIAITGIVDIMELIAGVLVLGLGCWLLASRLRRIARRPVSLSAAAAPHVHAHAHADEDDCGCGHDHGHGHAHGHDHGHAHSHHAHAHEHAHDHDACCGHAHMPGPALAAGPMDWRKAGTAVLSVGLRPCAGAILVLVFALQAGLFAVGVGAVLLMGLGTAITVSILATCAAGLSRAGRSWSRPLAAALEIGGALSVILLGVVMLALA